MKQLSESAIEKLSRYQFAVRERDVKIQEAVGEEEKHRIVLLYSPPINMLSCAFADQVIEDMKKASDH